MKLVNSGWVLRSFIAKSLIIKGSRGFIYIQEYPVSQILLIFLLVLFETTDVWRIDVIHIVIISVVVYSSIVVMAIVVGMIVVVIIIFTHTHTHTHTTKIVSAYFIIYYY